MNISSILRHWFTAAFFAAAAWLVGFLTLSADDAKALTDAFANLIEPLIIIVALVATALVRVLIAWAGKKIPSLADLANKYSGGTSGGTSLLIMGTMAGFVGLSLPSCSPLSDGVRVQAKFRSDWNPLDQPGSREPTVAELHRANVRIITALPSN